MQTPATWRTVRGICGQAMVIALLLLPSAGWAVTLTRGPYIQLGNTNRVTIVWKTDVNANSVVEYGLTTAYDTTNRDLTLVKTHVATLTNLLPGTTYFYRVRSAGVVLTNYTFDTTKQPGRPFRFVFTGDSGSGTTNQWNAGNGMRDALPDLAVHGGDVVYDAGEESNYDAQVFQPYGDMLRRVTMWPVLGNHDIITSNGSPFLDNWYLPLNGEDADERSYWFEYGDALFLCLNANPGQQQSAAWVQSVLSASSKRWKIVVFHHPARTTRTGHSENLYMRDTLGPIFEAGGVNLCLQAHNHHYERIYPINGVHYVVQGAGGKTLYPLSGAIAPYSAYLNNSVFSYTVLDVNGPQLTHRTFSETGTLLDEVTIDQDCPFALDGVRDASATPVATRAGGQTIWAAFGGRYLYLATENAGAGDDVFLFLARTAAGLTNFAAWGKTGQVMQADAFLADENDNQYSDWYHTDGTRFASTAVAQAATRFYNDGVLEGVIDLQALYGTIPATVLVAAVSYATTNNAPLDAAAQCPAGNGDGNLDTNEFVTIALNSIRVPSQPFTMDGLVDAADYEIADRNGMKLWAAVRSNTLYVSTWAAGDDNGPNDHFIFVSDSLTNALEAAPWAKTGLVAFAVGRLPYLADEGGSSFAGWFNGGTSAQAIAATTNSGQLEGSLDLLEAFGRIPPVLYLAVAPYATADGGALYAPSQIAQGNDDGNIDSNEWVAVPLNVIADANTNRVFDTLEPTGTFAATNVVWNTSSGTAISWPALPGRTYRVSATTNLLEPFDPLTGLLSATQQQFGMTFIDTLAATTRFYRVEFLPPSP